MCMRKGWGVMTTAGRREGDVSLTKLITLISSLKVAILATQSKYFCKHNSIWNYDGPEVAWCGRRGKVLHGHQSERRQYTQELI